jgi:cation-transporting ATPase 13A1
MRKILFASERITENSKETFFFILILLCCAIMASFTVLKHSLYDENRNKYKLILHCIMIITSVVPPELPMELSVAVTNSLNTLSKAFVYCTEPFRIPYAGKVSILCFDKTGTLTQDKMILKGVVDGQEISASGVLEDSSNYINCGAGDELAKELDDIISPVTNVDDCDTCADGVLIAMASCHSLYYINKDKIVGDPMELEAFHHSGFSSNMNLSQSSTVDSIVHQGRHISVKIKQRFLFSSELKRMSVLIEVASVNTKEANSTHQIISTSYMVCCKGAPEIIENLLHHIPPRYRETYLYHMKLGRRVLALSYKLFNSKEEYFNTIHNRQDIENQLIFAGFLIFDSNLKSDTKSVIKELRSTENKIVMITGDSPYTSSDVGKRISLLTKDKPTIILDGTQISHSSNVSTPVTISNLVGWTILAKKEEELKKEIIFNNLNDFSTLSQTYNICVTGNAIEILEREFKDVDVLRHICQYINIYARVIPVQKENIIKAYNNNGLCTLMCGDGTNDVGALRVSNIGISIINNYELEKQLDNKYNKKKSNSKSSSTMSSRDRALRAITEIELQDSDPTLIKLGDASIASPFTARRTSIDVVLTVLRQGRCTLVTTIQVSLRCTIANNYCSN